MSKGRRIAPESRIASRIKAETTAQYQLLKVDTSGRYVTKKEYELPTITVITIELTVVD